MQFLASPVLGALSDRYGRRPVLVLSTLGLGLDYLLMALAPNLWWLFVGRVLSGTTTASYSTAYAYLADATPPDQRAGVFGLVGAASGVGFVLGPALGGLLGAVEPRLPFWVAAGLSLANALYGYCVLPESLPPDRRMAFSLARANPVGSLRLLARHRELLGMAGVFFLYQPRACGAPVRRGALRDLSIWLERDHHGAHAGGRGCRHDRGQWRPGQTHDQPHRLARHPSARPVMRRGRLRHLCLRQDRPGLLGWHSGPGAVGPQRLGGTCMMSGLVGPSEQGQLQGANSSLTAIAELVGPGIFTLIFAWAIPRGIPGTPFLLAAGLLIVATALGFVVTRPRPGLSPGAPL
jgi:MFS transporter, DHA1 family, tetracycline resistance protein